MNIIKINKRSDNINKWTNIIYKNFINLVDNNVNHTKKEIYRILTSDHNNNYVLCNNNIFIGYIISEDIVISDGRLCCFIYYIYISSKYRGKRLSKFLLNKIIDDTYKKGISFIMLLVNNKNNKAINLYKKYNFKEDNFIETTINKNNDFIAMTLRIK